MVREKTEMGGRFNPENYGMIFCPLCKGPGRLFDGMGRKLVCEKCGGFGLVKKEEEVNNQQLQCGRSKA